MSAFQVREDASTVSTVVSFARRVGNPGGRAQAGEGGRKGAFDNMFGRNRENRTSLPSEVFPSLDFDAIAKQLRLKVRGLENGRADSPDSTAADFDPVEREIVAAVDTLRRQGLENAAEHARVYRERIAADDSIGPGIRQIANDAETDFQREVDARHIRLNSALKDLHQSEADLAQFKQDNGLNRTAYETGGLWQWWAICAIIVLLESGMNGFFFAETNIAGLAGGTITALVISIVNVGVASLAGHAFRQKNHIRFLRRFAGWIFLIIGGGLAVFINFLVGHFRDLTATVPWNEAAGAAFERVVAGHVQMHSLDAWLLTSFGLLIAAFACWKAYGAVDPYPGYSRVSDNFAGKRREWQDLKEETLDALIDTRDEAVADLENECGKLRNDFESAQSARAGLSELTGRKRQFLRECDRVVSDLLAVYRDANRKARTTPEPAYFQQPFSVPAEEEPVEPPPPNPDAAQQSADLVKEAVERIHRTCQDALDSFSDERSSRV